MKHIILNTIPPKEENELKCNQHTNSKQLIYSIHATKNWQFACREATPCQLTIKCRHPSNYREKRCLVPRELNEALALCFALQNQNMVNICLNVKHQYKVKNMQKFLNFITSLLKVIDFHLFSSCNTVLLFLFSCSWST